MPKVAVATNQGGLDDQVSQIFGRCQSYTFVETEGGKIKNSEVAQNQNATATSGAGIQAAGFVANQGADAVIAGNFGPNVASVLNESGVDMFPASGITVREAVQKYMDDELQPVTQATASAKRGIGRGGGRGMGGGMRQKQPGQGSRGSASQQQPSQAPQKSSGQIDENRIQELEDKMDNIEKALGKLKDELEDLESDPTGGEV